MHRWFEQGVCHRCTSKGVFITMRGTTGLVCRCCSFFSGVGESVVRLSEIKVNPSRFRVNLLGFTPCGTSGIIGSVS